jgi:hypothetical protein
LSTGFKAIHDILNYGPEKIKIVGMDFNQSLKDGYGFGRYTELSSPPGMNDHLTNENWLKNRGGHNFNNEFKQFKELYRSCNSKIEITDYLKKFMNIQQPKFLLIGNGKSALNLKDRINDYDIVVRFNNKPLNDNVGYRTDMMILNGDNFNLEIFRQSNCHYMKPSSTSSLTKMVCEEIENSNIENSKNNNFPKVFDGKNIQKNAPVKFNKDASTGLLMILFLLNMNYQCTVIGFDNLTHESTDLTNNHYYNDSTKAYNAHDWNHERKLVKQLPIKVLK